MSDENDSKKNVAGLHSVEGVHEKDANAENTKNDIADVIKDYQNIEHQKQIKEEVKKLCAKFPVYEEL